MGFSEVTQQDPWSLTLGARTVHVRVAPHFCDLGRLWIPRFG